jgi:HD-like signal output (HDOD) protein
VAGQCEVGLVNFPSPPGVATHIIELARDPGIEMGKVAKALSMDSALATKILRIANSPLYAQRPPAPDSRRTIAGASRGGGLRHHGRIKSR